MCDYDVDSVCADEDDDAAEAGEEACEVTVGLPAGLAAQLRGLVPGPLDAAVCAILWVWVARTSESMGLVAVTDKD